MVQLLWEARFRISIGHCRDKLQHRRVIPAPHDLKVVRHENSFWVVLNMSCRQNSSQSFGTGCPQLCR